METTTVGALCSLIAYVVGLFTRGFLPSYMKEKGKNLATKEDIRDLAAQTALLTQTTEQIKAEITDKVWNKQRQWEMKRDAVFSAIQALDRADSALLSMTIAFKGDPGPDEGLQDKWAAEKTEAMRLWREAINGFDDHRTIVTLVCSAELSSALTQASSAIRKETSKFFMNNALEYQELSTEIAPRIVAAQNRARIELGIEN